MRAFWTVGGELTPLAVTIYVLRLQYRVFLGGKDGNLLEHFEAAKADGTIPSFENLRGMSQTLFNRYGHPHAFERAIEGISDNPAQTIPVGDEWIRAMQETSSAMLLDEKEKGKKRMPKAKKKITDESDDDSANPSLPFRGDLSLAQSCRFLYDATISREAIYITADGDVGRLWEVMKVYPG